MTVRTYVYGSLGTAIGAGLIWLLTIFFLDPQQAGAVGYLLFFLSLFLWVASLIGLGGYGIRAVVSAQQFRAYSVRTSLRQGVGVASLVTILLLLQLGHLYRWWIALTLVALLLCLELLFLSYDRAITRRSSPPPA